MLSVGMWKRLQEKIRKAVCRHAYGKQPKFGRFKTGGNALLAFVLELLLIFPVLFILMSKDRTIASAKDL